MSKRSIGEREAFDDWVTSEVAIKLSDECEAFDGWELRVSSVAIKLSLYPTGENLLR
ncbi:MAG: hypothetical protein IKS10_05350 [Lachnospiraceae bacterium]|nr:hypothetical protein [Lachnospiraceae bacterium]